MQEYVLRMIGGTNQETAKVVVGQKDGCCSIVLTYRGRSLEASAPNYFAAFCRIRLELEKDKLIPFCFGASRNVYPSGMCCDMGEGLAAYRLTLGRKPTNGDLVNIFAEGPGIEPSYVADQKKFFAEWWKAKKN